MNDGMAGCELVRCQPEMYMKARFIPVFLLCAVILSLGACGKPTPITGTATSADGVPIKYETVGKGRVALVFVHCWMCNRGFWDDQVMHFADRYRVVRLDLAGHGESGRGREAYTMSAFGADVAAVVGKLELTEVIVVGHSMGGPVGTEAEKLLGGRVIGVVGVDSFYTGFEPPTGSKVAEFIKPFEKNFSAQTDNFARSMFMRTAHPALVNRIAASLAEGDKEVAISVLKEAFAWYEHDSEAALQRVGHKLRNINADPKGENKPLHPSVVLIPGVGHFVPQEKPMEFNRALDGIVQQFVDGSKKSDS